MSEQDKASTWYCAVCKEDHPITPAVTACWVKDGRRLDALESTVQRIEARVTGGRPTPPGVFPPMSGAPVVTRSRAEVAGMYDGRRASGVTHEYVTPTGSPLAPSEDRCSYSTDWGSGCMLPAAHRGVHVTSPAEAAIFERGGYVLSDAAETSRLAHVGTGCWCKLGEACPDLMRQRAEANRRKAAARENMDRRIKDATRAMEQRNAEEMSQPRPTGGIVGLDVMLPPISDVVTPKTKALLEKWGSQGMGDSIMAKALEKHGAALEAACKTEHARQHNDATLVRSLVALLSDFAGDHGDSEGAEDCLRRLLDEVRAARARNRPTPTHEGPCNHGVPCPTPAAMLGEALQCMSHARILFERLGMPRAARALDVAAVASHNETPRDAETRLVNCPCGIHDGPGSDACDCAAIAKVEARDVRAEPAPAELLGEAVALLERVERLVSDACGGDPDVMDTMYLVAIAKTAVQEKRRIADVGETAAGKREAEAREGRGDRVESRLCNQDGHRWSGAACAFCGADRAEEGRRGGPAVDRATEDA